VLDPLRRASSMLDSHDIASVDDSQLWMCTKSYPCSVLNEGKEMPMLPP
jgi:hypothetical protein